MLYNNAVNKRRDLRGAIGCLVMAAVFVPAVSGTAGAATKPTSVAEIALYQGPDRGQILIEGAKKEGQVMLYNSNTWMTTVAQEFEKKYPFVKVSVWRSESPSIIKRVTEEYASGRFIADVIEDNYAGTAIVHKKGMFQEYYTPDMALYGDEVKVKGKAGVYYLQDRELYIGLGFNTKLVPPADAPKTYNDLLDPKWKGKMFIVGTDTGVRWVGLVLNIMGREYLEKMGRQDVKIQNISGAALANLIVSGEVLLSPTIFDSNIHTAKEKDAPVEWRPLEPVLPTVGTSGILTRAPHPYGALLFLDYIHSIEGQQVVMKGGLSSPRKDIGSLQQKFKKTYFDAQYSPEEFEKKFSEWEELMRRLFIRRK